MEQRNPDSRSEMQGVQEAAEEAALLEEVRQLRAALKIYRDLVQRLLRERQGKS